MLRLGGDEAVQVVAERREELDGTARVLTPAAVFGGPTKPARSWVAPEPARSGWSHAEGQCLFAGVPRLSLATGTRRTRAPSACNGPGPCRRAESSATEGPAAQRNERCLHPFTGTGSADGTVADGRDKGGVGHAVGVIGGSQVALRIPCTTSEQPEGLWSQLVSAESRQHMTFEHVLVLGPRHGRRSERPESQECAYSDSVTPGLRGCPGATMYMDSAEESQASASAFVLNWPGYRGTADVPGPGLVAARGELADAPKVTTTGVDMPQQYLKMAHVVARMWHEPF